MGRVENWPLCAVRVYIISFDHKYYMYRQLKFPEARSCTAPGRAALPSFRCDLPAKMYGHDAVKDQHSMLRSLWSHPESCFLHIRSGLCRPCVISVMSVFWVHLVIYQQQQLQLPEALTWAAPCQGRRYGPPMQHSLNHRPLHPSPPDKLGRTPCWVNSLRPSAFVSYPWGQQQQILQKSLSDRNPGGLCSFTLFGKKSKTNIWQGKQYAFYQSMSMWLFIHIYVGRSYVCGKSRIILLKTG